MCPHCGHMLRWFELIPVISYLSLRGRCRKCHKVISLQYPIVEILTALIWVMLAAAIAPVNLYGWLTLGVWLIISSLLIAACIYDARWMLLPDTFTVPVMIVAAVWLLVRWAGFHEGNIAITQLIGAGIFSLIFWALNYYSKGRLIGDGDAGLALIMGLLLTTAQLVIAIFISFNLGALVGLILILSGRKTRKDQLPFGPFLIIGLLISFLFGNSLVAAYFSILGG